MNAITRYNGSVYPVEVRVLTTLEIPKGKGFIYGDGEYDSRLFLNKLVEKGYMPVVKPRKISAGGYGARIRDRVFNAEIYKRRSVCEGFFGALTNWFGENVPCTLIETTISRIVLRVICYALRIMGGVPLLS